MLPIQKNSTRAAIGGVLLLSVAYFAGSKRCLEYLQGATRKELLGAASAGALANLIFRHEDPKKSAAISAAMSMLCVAATLKALEKGSKWAPLTYLKVGAVQATLFGGAFSQTKLYYESGKLKYKGEVQGGEPHGQGKFYEKDGALSIVGAFKAGLAHGYGKEYYDDGINLMYKGMFENNEFSGLGKYYYTNGKLRYEGTFKEGEFHGQGKLYHENSRLKYEGVFEGDQFHGHGTLYSETGQIVHQGEFARGEFVS